MIRFFIVTFLYCLALAAAAQVQPEPMRFGVVPATDLSMKVYAADTSANAVVLGESGAISFFYRGSDLGYRFVHHKRIKLLRRAALDDAAVSIPYFTQTQKIKSIKAAVIAPDGTVTTVPEKDFFREKATDKVSRLRFTFPNLTEGSVVEYVYALDDLDIFTLPEWHFQGKMPVRYSELLISVPQFLDYITIHQGLPLANEAVKTSEKAMEGLDTGNPLSFYSQRFSLSDAPALHEEPFITTMDNYYTSIRFQLSTLAYPGQPIQPVLSTWPKAAEELLGHPKFGDQLKQKRHYSAAWEAAEPVAAAAADSPGKIAALYRFVTSAIQVEDGRGVMATRDLEDLFEQKRARGHEMNLLLVALLRKAGFTAHPVLVSTRDHGRPVPLYPILDQFNYVLAAVNGPDGNRMLLDAGAGFHPPGLIGSDALNGEAWLVDAEKPEWISLPGNLSQDVYLGTFTLDETGTLQGQYEAIANGYSGAHRRENLGDSNTEKFWKQTLQDRFPEIRIDSTSVHDAERLEKAIRETMTLTIPGFALAANEFLYITPVPFSSFLENPFKAERRFYPVELPYPFKESNVISLDIPAGYGVEALPEALRLVLPKNGGRFQYVIEKDGNQLKLNCTIHLSQVYFDAEEYDVLRSFFGRIVTKLGEQVVLRKL